jgi:ABC-type uncharacterized transport system permease subunit
MPLVTGLVGLLGFALCTLAGYLYVRRGQRWASTLVVIGAVIGIGSNVCYLVRGVMRAGVVETFGNSFESTLLLASLLGLVGLGCYLSRRLRGLDGLLMVMATLAQIGALLVINRTGNSGVPYKPWFVSHALAFQVSAACFMAGGAAGIAYLLTSYVLRRKRAPQMVGTVAPLETIERFEWWALVIGFPLFTYGILTGICEMVRAPAPGARAWLADPLIIASFITWAVYALLIGSMWLQPQMRGRRAATMVTCGTVLIAMVFLVIEFVSPLHR